MDVLIESTKSFEKDIDRLSADEKSVAIEKINDCVSLFPNQKFDGYRKFDRVSLPSELNGYESSLYILKVSYELSVILSVDEDPIFGQIIFTLFRVVKHNDLDRACQVVAQSLYGEMLDRDRQTVQI